MRTSPHVTATPMQSSARASLVSTLSNITSPLMLLSVAHGGVHAEVVRAVHALLRSLPYQLAPRIKLVLKLVSKAVQSTAWGPLENPEMVSFAVAAGHLCVESLFAIARSWVPQYRLSSRLRRGIGDDGLIPSRFTPSESSRLQKAFCSPSTTYVCFDMS